MSVNAKRRKKEVERVQPLNECVAKVEREVGKKQVIRKINYSMGGLLKQLL